MNKERGITQADEKRGKLLLFAGLTLTFLTLAALYFEVLYPHETPLLVRMFLTIYWVYSLAGLVVSQVGSDTLVSKMYLNVNR